MKRKSNAPIAFSLPRRLLALFLFFALSLYAAGMGVAAWLEEKAIQEVRQMYTSRVSSLAEQLDAELERIQLQINYTATRTDVQHMELVTPSMAFSEIYTTVRQVGELMYALQNASALIEEASIFLPQLNRAIFPDGSYRTPSAEDEEFVRAIREGSGRALLVTANGQLYLVSDSMRISSAKKNSIIRVQLSERSMAEWCARFSENSQICLLGAGETEEPYFFSVGNAKQPEETFQNDLEQAVRGRNAENGAVHLDGTEYLRIAVPVGSRDLWVSGYIAMSALRGDNLSFSLWRAVLTAFLLLELLLFLYILRKMIAQPINRFIGEVQSLKEEGVLQLSEQPGSNMDFLYSAFRGVSEQLKTSLEQAYSNKLLAYQSEIKFLQAQVNPHFLYNSFYHLYRMAKMEDNEGVAEMSQRLSSYYRYITRSDQNEVPLSMEYENIEDYTDIQTIRFGDRIQVELEPLPPEYAQLKVPRFVLQPLFENAYNHGVEKITGGVIRLRFEPGADRLVIYVENNGACSDESLQALDAYLESSAPGEKITALKNGKGRMQLLGGDLRVSRGSLGGFCAALMLSTENAGEGTA